MSETDTPTATPPTVIAEPAPAGTASVAPSPDAFTAPSARATVQRPSINRNVHYVRDGKPPLAAIITAVWSDTTVNLVVFGDGDQWADGTPADVASCVVRSATLGTAPGSWAWPPFVPR